MRTTSSASPRSRIPRPSGGRDDAGELFERGQARRLPSRCRRPRATACPQRRPPARSRHATHSATRGLRARRSSEQLEDPDPALVARPAAARAPHLAVQHHSLPRRRHDRGRCGRRSAPRPSASTSRSSSCRACAPAAARCTAETADPVRNGSTPISFRRVIAPGGVVRVQRREHHVPGECRLDRHLRRLGVPDLADHDHVGVGAQDRAQRRGERHVRLDVDLHLVDAGQPVLDRILDRDDVDLRPVDLGECRVERRRLARAGRPGDEQRSRSAGG